MTDNNNGPTVAAAKVVVVNPEDAAAATDSAGAGMVETTMERTTSPSRRNMPKRASKTKLSSNAFVAERDGSDVDGDKNEDKDDEDASDNADEPDENAETKLKKKKRQRTSISKAQTKRKRKKKANAAVRVRAYDDHGHDDDDDDDDNDRDHPKTRQEFERHRAEILSLLPDQFKSMFGQVGFGKYARGHNPALILHPFDLVPPQVRTKWIDTVRKFQRQGTLDRTPQIVYWYDAGTPSDFYGYAPEFIPYEQAVEKGLLKPLQTAFNKFEQKKTLKKIEQDRVRAYLNMQEDLRKEPHDRLRGTYDFSEDFQDDTSLPVPAPAPVAEASTEDHGEISGSNVQDIASGEDSAIIAPASTKKKKGKIGAVKAKKSIKEGKTAKSKAKSDTDDRPSGMDGDDLAQFGTADSDDSEESAKKKKSKESSSIPLTENVLDDRDSQQKEEEEEAETDEALPKAAKKRKKSASSKEKKPNKKAAVSEEKAKSLKKKSNKRTKKDEIAVDTAQTEEGVQDTDAHNVAAFEGSTDKEVTGKKRAKADMEVDEDVEEEFHDDDEKDESFDGNQDESEAEDDLDFNERPQKVRKRLKAVSAPEVKRTRKQEQTESTAVKRRSRKAETKKFLDCEEKYGDLIKAWYSAIQDRNTEALSASLTRVEGVVENFTFPFIEAYLGPLHAQSKAFLKALGDKGLLAQYEDFRKMMKKVYTEEKYRVHENYKLPKTNIDLESLPGKNAAKKNPTNVRTGDEDSTRRTMPKKDGAQSSSPKPAKDVKDSQKIEPKSKSLDTSKVDVKAPSRAAPSSSASTKPERRAFSLGTLMKRDSKPSAEKTSSQTKASQLPKWLTEKSMDSAPPEGIRFLGLEFLKAMASKFPDESGMDKEAVALALENAIWSWALKQKKGTLGKDSAKCTGNSSEQNDLYWDRVHAVVAAVCGKAGSGTLMHLIKNGEFQSASKVVELGDDALLKSFEGHPFV